MVGLAGIYKVLMYIFFNQSLKLFLLIINKHFEFSKCSLKEKNYQRNCPKKFWYTYKSEFDLVLRNH